MCSLLFLVCLAFPVAVGGEPLRVIVSVPPQKTFVERIGGSLVHVQSLLRAGQSPHTYDPTPRQVSGLANADLYVRIGVPFEDAWITRLRSANPAIRVVDGRRGMALRADAEHGDDDEINHDPHIWTSPPLVKQMGQNVRDALTEMIPAQQRVIDANYRRFAAELDLLDREIRHLLSRLVRRQFMVFHPAWGYFADTYGLTQVPIERDGKEPGARSLAALIERAKREQMSVIFVQPQMHSAVARQLARAIDGRVETLDPLAPDYFENMRRVAHLISAAERP